MTLSPEAREAVRFRKKPVVIEAWQWDGVATAPDRPEWLSGRVKADHNEQTLSIKTLEGVMVATVGDWIIKGVKGEVYPCKPDIFAATYEPAAPAPPASGGLEAVREAMETRGPYEARVCKDVPSDCCDYGVVSLTEGREVCRVWREQDARAIAAALAAPATPAGADYAGDITPHDDKERGMAVLRDAYDFDIADDGTLCGLVAGDQGWASTHIKIKPAPTGASVPKVKALEWEENKTARERSCKSWLANTPFGTIWIELKKKYWISSDGVGQWRIYHETLDHAKAAAQADYETRIRSALEGRADG